MFRIYGKCSKTLNSYTFLFLYSNKFLIIRAGINKMLARKANREEQSDLDLSCVSRHFGQDTRLRNFRTPAILYMQLSKSICCTYYTSTTTLDSFNSLTVTVTPQTFCGSILHVQIEYSKRIYCT